MRAASEFSNSTYSISTSRSMEQMSKSLFCNTFERNRNLPEVDELQAQIRRDAEQARNIYELT